MSAVDFAYNPNFQAASLEARAQQRALDLALGFSEAHRRSSDRIGFIDACKAQGLRWSFHPSEISIATHLAFERWIRLDVEKAQVLLQVLKAEYPPVALKVSPPSLVQERSVKSGRPKGSKNRAKRRVVVLPVNEIKADENLIPAVLDLLWRKPGMLMSELMDHVKCEDAKRSYYMALIHQSPMIEIRASGRTKNGRTVQRLYAMSKRRGWYFKGRLWTLNEMVPFAKVTRNAVYFRLINGWPVSKAVSNPADPDRLRN